MFFPYFNFNEANKLFSVSFEVIFHSDPGPFKLEFNQSNLVKEKEQESKSQEPESQEPESQEPESQEPESQEP